MAVSAEQPHNLKVLLASNHANDTQGISDTQTKPDKAPARQVPVEPFDEPSRDVSGKDAEKPAGESSEQDKEGIASTAPPAHAKENEKEKNSIEETKTPVKQDTSTEKSTMTAPDLPLRNPSKPVFRKQQDAKKDRKKPAISGSVRDKKLCKALQKCRNKFIKCKNKIKHPDQSEPWIIAKEVCGGYYKTCVEKDFQAGEWFMTRWFYFQELNCGQ
jgi:hypothetical protein